jgi:predicted nuclease of predicted toxin-antitoxin system
MPLVNKFHLDEHVSPAIAAGLRRRGIDVTTTREVGLQDLPEQHHIAFALPAGRVIVTHDDDYLLLHAQGVRHAGIAYCHQHARSIGRSSAP